MFTEQEWSLCIQLHPGNLCQGKSKEKTCHNISESYLWCLCRHMLCKFIFHVKKLLQCNMCTDITFTFIKKKKQQQKTLQFISVVYFSNSITIAHGTCSVRSSLCPRISVTIASVSGSCWRFVGFTISSYSFSISHHCLPLQLQPIICSNGIDSARYMSPGLPWGFAMTCILNTCIGF